MKHLRRLSSTSASASASASIAGPRSNLHSSPSTFIPSHPQLQTCCRPQPLLQSQPKPQHHRQSAVAAAQTRIMSTMPASHGHSAACCNIPPIVSKGYQPKGSYEEVGGYKTYVTGPADATKAIVVIFDIFGYFDQTVQGADILAYGDDHHKYKVFMPDWFRGKPCPIEYYPPDTPEKQEALGKFFGEFPPPKIAGYVPEYVDGVKAHSPAVSKLALLGYCWGGKVVSLTVKAPTNPFVAAASAHPAMVDPADAEGLTIPFALLASGDEPPEDVKKFEENLKVPHHVETFADQIHGWMAARSDLTSERVKAEYERGYKTLLEFFGKHV
ncbi:Alpha/Beta hydrolase protein [Trichoderma pleuroticola]